MATGAFGTELHHFKWFASNPEHLKYFNDFMALRRGGRESWLGAYPVREETEKWVAGEKTLFVNIGEGIGHQCVQFKAVYPDRLGRVVS